MSKFNKEEIEESWNLIKSSILREDGLVDWDKLKNLLCEFHFTEEQASKVYMTITNGKMSKVNYHSEDVIAVHEDELNKLFIERPRHIDLDFAESEDWVQWVTSAIEEGKEVTSDEKLISEYHTALFNYVENHKMILSQLDNIKKAKNVKDTRKIVDDIISDQSI